MATITIPIERYSAPAVRAVAAEMAAKCARRKAQWDRDQSAARQAAIDRRRERLREFARACIRNSGGDPAADITSPNVADAV